MTVPRAPASGWRRLLAAHWLILVVTSIALLLLLSKLTKEVVEGQLKGVDVAVRSWTLAHRTPAGMRAFATLTLAGSLAASLLIGAAAAAWLWIRKRRLGAAVFASTPALATFLFLSLKDLVGRPRPPGAEGILTNYSFPSGHMTAATGLWVTLMYLLWRERLLALLPAIMVAAGWPLLVGISRVYLDLHWASDVLGGWLLGLGLALAAAAVYERRRARARTRAKT